ncbi:hypothetical protein PBI_TEAMOCIL_74 [Microbacterium phage Teamocil]|uniref:Uncharacterized protein n=1 Tax=Microbacterium phage Teamocil TaxID=2656554 RepID=A0A649VYI1_9CAUD|nr:hypothetical protein QDA12_gp74 [Microbacterium phage Teamocil]QGJ88925.1 hypothetical protein PBI_GINA_74 [Microbacterium phage Gina]QGJ97022.1 hypothetical protein PBI_TEAMOCIL_74 [Microbacterium phage Teamocil]
MAEEPVKCRAEFALVECDLPLHHEGGHHAEMSLPPGVGPFIDHAWEQMDKARRSYYRWRWWFIILTLAQAVFLINRIIEGVPQ